MSKRFVAPSCAGGMTGRAGRARALALAGALGAALALARPPAARAAPPEKAPAASEREQRLAKTRDARAAEEAAELFRTAETTYLVGDLERAGDLYQRVATIGPASPYAARAGARLGDCAYEAKRFDQAALAYRKAAALAGAGGGASADEAAAAVRADYMVAQSYLAARQYTQAFGNFRAFIDRHPGHPLVNTAYQSIGDAHLALEQYQQSLSAYRLVGTVIPQKTAANKRVAPGQRLYLRVTDADVNIGDTPKSVFAVVRTTAGDEERVEMQPLGLRSAVFIASLPTALGDPRRSGDVAKFFSDEAAAKLRAELADAERLQNEAAQKSREARELESGGNGVDPAGAERKRAAAAADARKLAGGSKDLADRAARSVDDAFAGLEKLVAAWSPEQSLDKVAERAKARAAATTAPAPATAPAEGTAESPAGEVKLPTPDAGGEVAPGRIDDADAPPSGGKDAGKKLSSIADEDLAPAATTLAPEEQARRGITQAQIDAARLDAGRAATTPATLDPRLTALTVWARSLRRQFQRLELVGGDTVTIEYTDEVGPAGPNDPSRAARRDVMEVASDARVALQTPDGRDDLEQAVLGGDVRLRVEDADRDTGGAKDTVTVVLSAVGAGGGAAIDKEAEAGARPAAAPATRRATPGAGGPDAPAAATQPAPLLPLAPEGAPSIKAVLTETAPHSGVFERTIHLDNAGIALDGQSLPLAPGKALRMAYEDARAVRNVDHFVLAKSIDCAPDRGGTVAAVRYQQTQLDLDAKLRRAVAAGELGKIYLDLGLARRGREYLSSAQGDCTEVADAAARTPLGEEALYHSWRIYFYAGLLDESVAAANALMARYPASDYVPGAMLQIGQVSLERGEKEAEEAKANNERAGVNRDLSRAVAQLSALAAKYPRSPMAPEAMFLTGRAKIAAGQTGIDSFERLAKDYPDSGFASRGLIRAGNYYVGVGDFRRAQEYFSRILVDYPDSPQLGEVLLHRGICQYKLGQSAEALRTLYQVVEEHSGTEIAHTAQKYVGFINQKRGE